jgi:hypothetical protein
MTFNLQRIAARQDFWNLKLQQLDQQRDLVRQNALNSFRVAQQSFSPAVLLATQHNRPSSECLHLQRKVASARSSCNFNLARKLEEELQKMMVHDVLDFCSLRLPLWLPLDLQFVTLPQETDAKEREAQAAIESRRLVDQHSFSVQKEANRAESYLKKEQSDIRECMVRVLPKLPLF